MSELDNQGTRSSNTKTIVTLAAVAVLAAGGGAIVANSLGGDSSQSGGGDGESAQTLIETTALGEHRGYDAIHQGGAENTLVTTDWLAEQIDEGLEESNIALIEVSEELSTSELTRYADGHIAGAVYLDWADFVYGNSREYITQDELTELLQGAGVNNDSTIVLYGDNNNWFAAYAAWVLKLHGADDVRLLDGGRLKWEEVDGRELVQEVPQPEAGNWEATSQNFDIRAFQPEVLDVVNGETTASLIDIRSEAEYNGEVGADQDLFPGEGAAVWGHIPDAINVTWTEIVNEEDGTFKSAEEIQALYEDRGVDFDESIITYCRIGERASHTWYALSQIVGADVKVYDGSWTEWGNSVGVPSSNNVDRPGGRWGSAS